MCFSMMGGHYNSGYEASSKWGDPPTLTADQAASLAEALADRGWAFIDDYIDMTAVEKMRTCWLDRYSNGEPGAKRINSDGALRDGRFREGSDGGWAIRPEYQVTAKALPLALLWTVYARYIEEGSRGDFVRWLSPQDEDCPVGYKWLRAGMDLLVQGLARNCRCAALEGVDTVVAQSSM
ncbi:hypothetical protein FOZ63_015166, partial [Perkinsus olseni]